MEERHCSSIFFSISGKVSLHKRSIAIHVYRHKPLLQNYLNLYLINQTLFRQTSG